MYSILIVLCTFGFHSLHSLGKKVFVFYFVSFTIGGGLFGIHFLLYYSFLNIDILYPNNIYGNEISLLFILIGFPLIWLFTKNRMDRHVKDKVNFDQIYPVIIEFNGQSYQTKGFVDSGNHLVDPLTNRPVAICDEKFIQSFFEKKEWDQLKNALEKNRLEHIPSFMKELIYVVPYKGVGGKSSYLYVFKPNKITIFYENKVLEVKKSLIGIQFAQLTEDQSYHCLLHPEMIQFSTIKSA